MHNYVTNTFLLVSSSVRSKQLLCFVHDQGQKREKKPSTKKFVEFHNHSPLLTMVVQKTTVKNKLHLILTESVRVLSATLFGSQKLKEASYMVKMRIFVVNGQF